MSSSSSSFEALERVSSKRDEWAKLSLPDKLELLNEMKQRLRRAGYETLHQQAGLGGLPMMGVPADTDEGKLEAESLCLLMIVLFQNTLHSLQEVYDKRVHNTLPQKLKTRKAINGQVCVEAFPTLATSKKSPMAAGCKGEVWLNGTAVTNEQDVKPYQYLDNDDTPKESGLMIVLGAGNQGGLALSDCLYGLYTRNCVVYLKLHALRYYTEKLIRDLFEPMIRRGYMDLECHSTNERAAALVHHPLVTAVHLTGGKATHDGIVWGWDSKEQQLNKQRNTPKLKAEMTSELGAVSPWIVVPADYTVAELKDQAGMLAAMIHANASCNCNAPKMIVVSESWNQKDQFLEILETSLTSAILPVPYYPGCTQRWQAFRDHYPNAKLLDSKTRMGVEERKLSNPLLSKEATLLPYLAIDLAIDLTTPEGRASAKAEYARNNEPFCPVYSVARLQHTDTLEDFCETAATFCNDYLFGSLSGTVTAKPALQSSDSYQKLIANLKYGSIGVNSWGGMCYGCPEGAWGAFPGEPLSNVESGIGRINNMLGLAHYEKFVLSGPIVSATHPKLESNLKKQTKILKAVNKLLVAPGIGPILELVCAIVGVDLAVASAIGGAAVAGTAGYLYTRSR